MTEDELSKIEKRLSFVALPVLEADIARLFATVRRLRELGFASGLMSSSPCFVCGYDGEGYFDPNAHPCATSHRALCKRDAWHKSEVES